MRRSDRRPARSHARWARITKDRNAGPVTCSGWILIKASLGWVKASPKNGTRDREAVILTSQHAGTIRYYAARERDIFRRVRIPNALPYLFTGLKVATVLAMIGAIVGDYFGGSQDALGIQIRRSAGIFAFEEAWAAIFVASVLGIAFYGAVALAERAVRSWHPSVRGGRE